MKHCVNVDRNILRYLKDNVIDAQNEIEHIVILMKYLFIKCHSLQL